MNTRQYKAKLSLLGMTQADLANDLQVTKATVNKAINSDKIPKLYIYAIEYLLLKENEQND